ncbi:RNA-binding protein [Nitratireductor sp. XY-223]|uniref:RNA-binding protein n=1 Tax=Nitratireductor sp. XY-223 TaxID=2561926 RepID=UPI0010A9BAA7|nr:RNA-binding protein [Nitratireductor sp. XY-223]
MGLGADMNDRTCIVTRQSGPADRMIRFVADPDGVVVPDLKARLPGRGCWVTAERRQLRKAMEKNLFARALKAKVTVPETLDETVDSLLVSALTGMIAMARKAGQVVTGSGKVEAAIRSGRAIAVMHASDAAPDGVRKMDQARRAAAASGSTGIGSFRLLSADEMAIVMAGGNVIHLAVLAGQAGEGVVKRAKMLDRYRNGAENGHTAGVPAQETETE